MNRLANKILFRFLALSLIAFIVVTIISYFYLKSEYINQTKSELNKFLMLATIELKNSSNPKSIINKIEKIDSLKVFIVDVKTHPEIKLLNGVNSFVNQKFTNNNYIYQFKIYQDRYYIIIAKPIESIKTHFWKFLLNIGFIYLIFLMLVSYFVYKLSNQISDETNKILEFLKEMINQKKAMSIESNFSKEFASITKLLTKTSKELKKRDKKKSKYTAKLKLANRQKDEIISAISHEFKNPISVINGYSQTLIEDKDILPKIRDRFLEKIHQNANKLNDLIDRLRLFTNLEDFKEPLKFNKIQISDIVNSAIDNLKETFPNREIKFTKLYNTILEVDKELFEIVIKNLIENALKYSDDIVEVVLDKDKLCVIDKGIGIPKNEIDNITKKFYRVSKNAWNNSLGIGLTIVNKIVNLHNFKLDITSKEFEGSTFCITFNT